MIENLYSKFGFPPGALVGKRVFKTLFHEHGTLTATDKAALTDDVDVITWQYTLKPASVGGTVAFQPYTDEYREYLEIAVLQVDLKTCKRVGRIHEVIQRAIPYPTLVVLRYAGTAWLGVAQKRFHQAHRGQIVAEDIMLTACIELAAPTAVQESFLDSLALGALTGAVGSSVFSAYSGWIDRVLAMECARLSGEFRVDPPAPVAAGGGGGLETLAQRRERRRQQLAACHAIEVELAEKRALAKKDGGGGGRGGGQLARLVELNNDIKRLEARLAQVASSL